uniref:NADH dehydrogenase subunit 3 n=1 Tax=Pseudopotamilla reniformis TaxID=279639 RepID=UPI001FB03A69|nr:NADH dehydrogenase subunit 3 [Pseudopotamilla reniformis]ULD67141.1 NADH dehydrogenase subunit 3 [Pseudopotamilla reniformis]
MLFPSFSIFFAITLSLLVIFMAWNLALKTNKDREKSSPFECGFDPSTSARIPFSTRFFLLAVLFLIFDIEIVLLLPLPIINTWSLNLMLTSSALILILLLGTLHEWREGSLNWTQ